MSIEKKVSTAVKILTTSCQISIGELAMRIGLTGGALSNKIYRDTFTGDDLAQIAEAVGAKLFFELPNGMKIPVESEKRPRQSE